MRIHYVMIMILLGIPLLSEAYAANENLFVSAENSSFENYFAGPMIIEVMVTMTDSIDIETGSQPDVVVNGKKLQMLQAIDGNWYGYFIDKKQALLADSTQQEKSPFGLQLGVACTPNTAYQMLQKTITFSDTVGVLFPQEISGPTGFGVSGEIQECVGAISTQNKIQNVIREFKELSDFSNEIEQDRIPKASWPFIQMYDFVEAGDVEIVYQTELEKQITRLTFDTVNHVIVSNLDRSSYYQNMPVFLAIQDPMLNIDPTDEDSWTFGTKPGSESSFYQLFDKNGNTLADGTSGAVDLREYLNSMMYDDNGFMSIVPDTNGIGRFALNLVDNGIQEITSDDITSARTARDSIPKGFQPITFVETGPNTGIFVNSDKEGMSNLIATSEVLTSAAVHYPENISLKIIVEISPEETIESEPIIIPPDNIEIPIIPDVEESEPEIVVRPTPEDVKEPEESRIICGKDTVLRNGECIPFERESSDENLPLIIGGTIGSIGAGGAIAYKLLSRSKPRLDRDTKKSESLDVTINIRGGIE